MTGPVEQDAPPGPSGGKPPSGRSRRREQRSALPFLAAHLSPDRLRSAVAVGLVAVVTVAPLAIGTVHPATRVAVFTACAALFAAVLLERSAAGKRFAITVPLVALAAAVAATALQLVPLPAAVIRLLSPRADELFTFSLGDYRHHALSVDPGGTVGELAKLAAYLAFYAAVCVYGSRRPARLLVIAAVAGTAALNALIGLVQALFQAPEILFFYRPVQEWVSLVRGTFVNPNHFGALLVIGAPCALSLALREPRLRTPAVLGTVLINIAAVLSLSRSAMLTLVVGQGLALALHRIPRRGSEITVRRRFWIVAGLAVLGGLGIASYVGIEYLQQVWSETSLEEVDGQTSKFRAWRDAGPMLADFLWTGAGRGAFEQAFTKYSSAAGYTRFVWAENGYLQAALDWGVPAALLFLALAGWGATVAARRMSRDPMLIGPFAAMVALAVHELFDFSVELPGVALPALALLATLYARRSSEVESGRRRVSVHPTALAIPAGIAALAMLHPKYPGASAAGEAFAATLADSKAPPAALIGQAEQLVRSHPADYFVPYALGQRLAHARHPDAIRWLNRAISLNPQHPGPDLVAAELLAARGRKTQALIQYRAAAEKSLDPRKVWTLAVKRYPATADLLRACGETPGLLHLLADWLANTGRSKDAVTVLRRVLEQHPNDVVALKLLARHAVETGNANDAPARVRELLRHESGADAQRLDVRARITAGDLDSAAALLDKGIDRTADTFDVELMLANALVKAGDLETARRRLDRLGRAWQLERSLWVKLHESRANLERQAGNEHQMRWELERRKQLLDLAK